MPSDQNRSRKGVKQLLSNASSKFEKAMDFLKDSPVKGSQGSDAKNKKSSSSKDFPASFSPPKETRTGRKLDFEVDADDTSPGPVAVLTHRNPKATRSRHTLLSFALMIAALVMTVAFKGCYIPFERAHQEVCVARVNPLLDRLRVTTAPVIATISDVTHSLVEFEEDLVTKFEGQIARIQNGDYPWLWRKQPPPTGVLVAILGDRVSNPYIIKALDPLTVMAEIGLGVSLALWIVSLLLRVRVSNLVPFSRG
jgi:hypothetical protein